MNADGKLDASLGRQTSVALDHSSLHLDRASHRVDHTAKLNENAVAGALDGAPMMRGDRRINQIAAHPPQPRQSAILVGAGEPAVSDDIGDQDRRDLADFGHGAPSRVMQNSTRKGLSGASTCEGYRNGRKPVRANPRRGFGSILPIRPAVRK
jgi:hypothetical protein